MLQSQKGIGLVEIIIAILIFSIGITAAMRTLPESNAATTRSRNLTVATNLAQEKIEELMGTPINDAQLSAGNHTDPLNPLERIFTRTWSVTDNVPLTDMKQVTVTASYTSGSNDNSVTLTTYLTSRR
ncbi:MAG TPA: prepilin-type N-terminal cleavage/methylation domain-containing protein [Patescibacteria group bacterium]|nr:prepilin-type N-terminal cleavage/methylation domain-containing protein [Patescibacteria group bacterium]